MGELATNGFAELAEVAKMGKRIEGCCEVGMDYSLNWNDVGSVNYDLDSPLNCIFYNSCGWPAGNLPPTGMLHGNRLRFAQTNLTNPLFNAIYYGESVFRTTCAKDDAQTWGTSVYEGINYATGKWDSVLFDAAKLSAFPIAEGELPLVEDRTYLTVNYGLDPSVLCPPPENKPGFFPFKTGLPGAANMSIGTMISREASTNYAVILFRNFREQDGVWHTVAWHTINATVAPNCGSNFDPAGDFCVLPRVDTEGLEYSYFEKDIIIEQIPKRVQAHFDKAKQSIRTQQMSILELADQNNLGATLEGVAEVLGVLGSAGNITADQLAVRRGVKFAGIIPEIIPTGDYPHRGLAQ